jgi:hypothetical protein
MNAIINFLKWAPNNPTFINLQLHATLAFFLLAFAVKILPFMQWPFAVVAVILAGVKEFYFDMKYESPPQPFAGALQDFSGYMIGIGLSIVYWYV